MAYVGRSPKYGFLEGQTATFNGSTTVVTLQRSVSSTDALDVYIDNVHQEPNIAYNLSSGGSAITFTGTPANGQKLYIRFHGISFDTARASKLTNTNADSTLTISDSHTLTLNLNGTTALTATTSGITIPNLTVTGTTTSVNSTQLVVGDNQIILNSDVASGVAPSEDAGIVINRGSSADVAFLWDEGEDYWLAADPIVSSTRLSTIKGGTTPTIAATTVGLFQSSATSQSAAISIIANSGQSSILNFGDENAENAGSLTYSHSADTFALSKGLGITGNIAVSGTVDGVDIAARDSVLTSTTTTANAALPKAGGTMTGALNVTGNMIAKGYLASEASNSTNKWLAYTHTDNTFRINYNGAGNDEVTITAGGNVGIGGAPSYLVHADASTATDPSYFVASSGSDFVVAMGSQNSPGVAQEAFIGTISNDDLKIKTNNTERIRINGTTGHATVGGTYSTAKLNLVDEDGGQPMLQVRNFNTNATGTFQNTHSVEFRSASSGGQTHGLLVALKEDNIDRRTLDVADNNGIFASFVQGKVGIGTLSPTQTQTGSVAPKLHVKADGTVGAYDLVARFEAGNDSSQTGASILINHSNDRGLLIEAGRANGGDIGVAHFGVTNSGGTNTRAITILATGATTNAVIMNTDLRLSQNGYDFTDPNGQMTVKTGRRQGTGTYTLFNNGSTATQSHGIVEIFGIYGTPNNSSYAKYQIGGARGVGTIIGHTQMSSIPAVSLAWSGANLQVSNSSGSLYYTVRVTLFDIGNPWNPTWGNLPGMN